MAQWFFKFNQWIDSLLDSKSIKRHTIDALFVVSMISVIVVCKFNWLSEKGEIIQFSAIVGFWVIICVMRVVYIIGLINKIKNEPFR